MERIALISDVHGNLTALEAVLADIDARGIDRIFNLGDYVGKGPRGREVVEICQERCEVNILGNWDDFLPEPSVFPGSAYDPTLAWWRDQLGPGQGEWLRSLPFSHDFTMSGRRIRLFHASATSVHTRVRFDHDDVEFRGMFQNTPATGNGPLPTVVAYGDTHDSFLETDLGLTLINTGSVGNALDDNVPVYVILEGSYDSDAPAPFGVQFVRVPYDVQAELDYSASVGAPDHELYVAELRDRRYRGDVKRGEPSGYHRSSRVAADTKDWTWTLEQRCPDCGFEASSVDGEAIGGAVRAFTAPWAQVVSQPGARRRPDPQTWSPVEYGAHIADVCRVFDRRLALLLTMDNPNFADWDQDQAAIDGDYPSVDPQVLAPALADAAQRLADAYDAVPPGAAWDRAGVRSNGSKFSVLTLGRYLLHDLAHHLHDVGAEIPALR
ncbi:metallophosphoesterase family protein [Calidifontibacter terrae]